MWVDVTSFSQGDKERIPTTFECRSGDLRIVITCGHIRYRGEWVMHCQALNIDTLHLKTVKTVEEAKERAIKVVAMRLDRLNGEFMKIEKL